MLSRGLSGNPMNNKEIQETLTVAEWGMWLRYVKKNNVKNEGGRWPDYDFHEFYTNMQDLGVASEDSDKGRGFVTRDKPVVPTDVPEGHGIGDSVGLHPYDHVPKRREAQSGELSLPEFSDGPENVGPSTEQNAGVSPSPEGELGA